ncbi:MAG: SUMF1/EgtB/PvdO family nonheme iron enzyme, partial [bacterium]|nr:SUMF1/EgtB/PvdO family nonheme iron enzyme [bacterium]
MNELTILHLSDIHFRKSEKEKKPRFRQEVHQALIDAVTEHSETNGFPDFAAVTGDVAFLGKKGEYDEAATFFGKLKQALPGNTEFLVIPGNHDVDREAMNKLISLQDNIVKSGKTGQFLDSPSEIRYFLNPKFNAYREFADSFVPGLYPSKEDYYWVKHFPDKDVTFLGLNTGWACEGDNDRHNIALGYPQVRDALEQAGECRNRIVLMHHPLFNWLEQRDLNKCTYHLFNQCRLILSGHEHFDSALTIHTPSESCIALGTNASYTHDGYIGFQFIRVEFLGNGTRVRVWPYRLEERERIAFYRDTRRWRGQKGKDYFDMEARLTGNAQEEPGVRSLRIPGEYKRWVMQYHSLMDVRQLDPNARAARIPLEGLYIPLETANPFYKQGDEERLKRGGMMLAPGDGGEEDSENESKSNKEPAYIGIEELLGRQHCILLRGGAGMGKTTLVKHLLYSIVNETGPVLLTGFLPVMILLRELWPVCEKDASLRTQGIGFDALLAAYLEKHTPPLPMDILKGFIKGGRALFLVDGLDEVPAEFRSVLSQGISAFRGKHPDCRFLLTGRPHGIDETARHLLGGFLQNIEPLNDEKIGQFIRKWFGVVAGPAEGVGTDTAKQMTGDVRSHPHVGIFTENPLLLTAVCILYLDNKRLPDQRVELYLRIVDNLMNRRFQHWQGLDMVARVEDYLKRLAFHMQERNLKRIDVGAAKGLLKEHFPTDGPGETATPYNRRIESLFDEIEPGCGLLNRPETGEVEFFHLTFQEFMAARYMVYEEKDYKEYLEKSDWEETLLLYAGLINREWKDKANGLVQEMLTHTYSTGGEEKDKDSLDLRRIRLLGGKVLRDIQPYKRDEAVVSMTVEILITIIESDASVGQRFEAGEILGYLGDTRFDIKVPDMVKVETGTFVRGSEEFDDEKPIRDIELDVFEIGKYPVTNMEFKLFVDDGGYTNKNYWTPEGWKWLRKDN